MDKSLLELNDNNLKKATSAEKIAERVDASDIEFLRPIPETFSPLSDYEIIASVLAYGVRYINAINFSKYTMDVGGCKEVKKRSMYRNMIVVLGHAFSNHGQKLEADKEEYEGVLGIVSSGWIPEEDYFEPLEPISEQERRSIPR
jgi:hypothetical protein